MRAKYVFDLSEGAAGDMILCSLIDLVSNQISFKEIEQNLEIAGNIMGRTKVKIINEHEGIQISIRHDKFCRVPAVAMLEYIDDASAELGIRTALSRKIIETLLYAEAEVHNTTIHDLHLHETGSPDTIVDIVGVSYLYEKLRLHTVEIYGTQISVGYGYIHTEHGLVEVPAPATHRILRGLGWVYGPYEGEMTTPTGAAILKCLLAEQIHYPLNHNPIKIGVGLGTRKFPKRTKVKLFMIG
jgi:hypothetical protein